MFEEANPFRSVDRPLTYRNSLARSLSVCPWTDWVELSAIWDTPFMYPSPDLPRSTPDELIQ